jgi:hypothetical protein
LLFGPISSRKTRVEHHRQGHFLWQEDPLPALSGLSRVSFAVTPQGVIFLSWAEDVS